MTWGDKIARKCHTSCGFYHTRVLNTRVLNARVLNTRVLNTQLKPHAEYAFLRVLTTEIS